ncbi:MAG: hypothetical protein JSW11_00505 [Candidatus Heimdallarchaeota archaeon]|nr:MAG: hypothetical protein JSW11_00505 [Candidatus Heimdallarchaeota archaeon]
MNIKAGDIVTTTFSDEYFVVEEVWSDKEFLAIGGLVIQISDVEEVLDSEQIADILLDRDLSW